MSDQAQTAVETDPEAALMDALAPEETTDELVDTAEETTETAEEAEETSEAPEVFKITVKNDAGEDEEKEVSLDELAKGYMLQADYTRKTQALAQERAKSEQEYSRKLAEYQQSSVDQLDKLQELVIRQAAPDLEGVNWVALSIEDPAKFVQLQAKQQALQNTFSALEQHKLQLRQQQEQAENEALKQALAHSDEYLAKSIKDFDGNKAQALLEDVHKHIGWTPQDLRSAAAAMAKAGMAPQALGQVLLLAHEALQFRKLGAEKKQALQKVVTAPKVVKPAAVQPKRTNQAASDRLKKFGRVEDLAALL